MNSVGLDLTTSTDSSLIVNGVDVPVRIKRNARARRLILRVNETSREINLTVPDYCDADAALSFLKKNKAWIARRLEKAPGVTLFEHGAEIPLRGENHKLVFLEQASTATAGQSQIVSRNEVDEPGAKPMLQVSGKPEHAPRRLQDWLKKEARRDLNERVTFHAGRLGLTPKRISIRDQRSRWGSCSSSGNLSFSWRLVLAPHHVLDYVAAHEVAHLAEMNHGPNFWKLVRQTMPDFEKAQSWLKVHGSALHHYGADMR